MTRAILSVDVEKSVHKALNRSFRKMRQMRDMRFDAER